MHTHQSIAAVGIPKLVLDHEQSLNVVDFMKPLARAAALAVEDAATPLSSGQLSLIRHVLVDLFVRCTMLDDEFDDLPRIATVRTALEFLEVDFNRIPDPDMPSWDWHDVAGDRNDDNRVARTELDDAADGACLLCYRIGELPCFAVLPSFPEAVASIRTAFADRNVELRGVSIYEAGGLDVTHASASAWLEEEVLPASSASDSLKELVGQEG